jgi:hypothetical protein
MNILYIGPYRGNSDDSEISRLYLKDLTEKHNVTARPVFLTDNAVQVDQTIIDLEKNNIKEYDCCIQHLPLSMLSYSGRFKQNVAIPIADPLTQINTVSIINQLNLFDSIIVNNKNDEVMLVRSGISSKIKTVDCPIDINMVNSIKDKKFNFGLHNTNHKFYFFGNYTQDIEIINKVILSFYLAFRCRSGVSLIMNIEGSPKDQEHLNKRRKEMKEQLEIIDYNNSINEIYIFDKMSSFNELVLHNSCDTLLSLYPRDSMLQKQYALFFGNNIIDKENTNVVEVPYSGGSNNTRYTPTDSIESVITNSLVSSMINFSVKGTNKQQKDIYLNKLSKIL